MPKSKDYSTQKPGDGLLQASYNAGAANGRLEAIEESMDAVAKLIVKAETLVAGLGGDSDSAMRDNAAHTLRALHLAFAAVTGSVKDSPAYHELLEQSRQRLLKSAAALH